MIKKADWERICRILHQKLVDDPLSWATYKVCGQEFMVEHVNLDRFFITLKGFELLNHDRVKRKRKFEGFQDTLLAFTIYH